MVREVLCFFVGAAAGFGVATYLMKSKYETMVEEETKSAMEWVKNKSGETETKEISHGEEVKEFNEIATNYSTIKDRIEEVGVVISIIAIVPTS